jgi:hypothetical protein
VVGSRAPELLIVTIVITTCATIFVLCRLYTRLALTRNLGYDDIFLAISSILDISLTALICTLTKYGVGEHIWEHTISDSHWNDILGFSARTVHVVVLTTTKLSICLFYRRIFQDRRSIILTNCLIAYMTIFTLALFIQGFFACTLGGAYWSPSAPNCTETGFVVYGSAVLSISVDLFLMAFAVLGVAPLRIARAQKASLYVIISLGWLAITASIIRAIRTGQTLSSKDPSWVAYDIDIWASIEVNTGLVCASAPALKPLIRKFVPNFLASISEPTSPSYSGDLSTGNGFSGATGPGEAIELGSHNNSTSKVMQDKFWTATGGSRTTVKDSESETGILSDDVTHGEILKSITATQIN